MKGPNNNVNPASRQRQARRQDAPPQIVRQIKDAQSAARQERATAKKDRHETYVSSRATTKTGKGSGRAGRDERRRQGGVRGGPALEKVEPATGNFTLADVEFSSGPLLRFADNPTLEQRIHAWLDVLVYVWRRRTIGEQARFIRNAHLNENEIAQIGQAVQVLSRGFTGHRRLVGKSYLSDPDLLGAYLLFYWPVSYAQAWTILNDQQRIHGGLNFSRVADIGSGPGPLSCAMLDAAQYFGETTNCQVVAVDHSPEALALLSELCTAAYGKEFTESGRLRTIVQDIVTNPAPHGSLDASFDCISYGHVLNELWSTQAAAGAIKHRMGLLDVWAKLLRPAAPSEKTGMPAFQLVIEPALKANTRALLQIRDNMAADGRRILGPCFFRQPCPALATEDGTCHGQVFWEQPGLIRRLATTARVSKEEIAMAWLAFGAASPEIASPEPMYRVVSEALINKAGRTRFMLCGPKGRFSFSALLTNAALDPKIKRKAINGRKTFAALRRGDAITIQNPEQREGGLGLAEDTVILGGE